MTDRQETPEFSKTVSHGVKAAFLDTDYEMIERFSEIEREDEAESMFLGITWNLYILTALNQTPDIVTNKFLKEKYGEGIGDMHYSYGKPPTDPENMAVLNLACLWNRNLMWAVVAFYHGHRRILNSRYSRDRKGRKEVIELTHNAFRGEEMEARNRAARALSEPQKRSLLHPFRGGGNKESEE